MPELHTSTRNATLLQQGYHLTFINWWVEGGVPIAYFPGFLGNAIVGLRYQIYDDMSLEKTRIRSLVLTIPTTVNMPPVVYGDVLVSMQMLPDTEVLSTANPPEIANENWLAFGIGPAADWVATPGVVTMVMNLGTAVTDPVVGTTLYDLAGHATILENPAGGGILNFAVQVGTGLAGGILNVINPTLVIEELDFFTGVAGAKGRERGDSRVRIARDSRFGMPTWTDELVEDEYTEGLWVRAEHKDPEDKYKEYTPNPREGTRDDDVPLE